MKLRQLTKQLCHKCRNLVEFGNVWLADGKLITKLDCTSMLRPSMYKLMDIPVLFVKNSVLQKILLSFTNQNITEIFKFEIRREM